MDAAYDDDERALVLSDFSPHSFLKIQCSVEQADTLVAMIRRAGAKVDYYHIPEP